MKKVNIGGDRLGSGNKMNVTLHGYERSNHDLSYLWKNTQAPGTLVPFMNILGLPGDTFDIDLDSVVKTMPTLGPLFGSFKLQLDIFTAPIRLYNKFLHNNKLGVGLHPENIKFPIMGLQGEDLVDDGVIPFEFQQINQSSILAYLGMRGIGYSDSVLDHVVANKNAIPYIAFWDIFKNYYANKMEDNAYVIHATAPTTTSFTYSNPNVNKFDTLTLYGTQLSPENITVSLGAIPTIITIKEAAKPESLETDPNGFYMKFIFKDTYDTLLINEFNLADPLNFSNLTPTLYSFPLKNLDDMREAILTSAADPFVINAASPAPYGLPLKAFSSAGTWTMYAVASQEGLPVKTYQSDIFNNWIQTEMIEGNGSIADITKISTAGDSFTLDTLNLSKKVYDLLNRVAVSGGSYNDYIEAVYDTTSKWRAETPIYHGGLSKEIVFQQIISTAATSEEPLGSLAGQGTMSHKHKGGTCVIHIDEPSFIIGIVSITPRVNYSQGNDWITNLKTLDDLHKPALDGIGYQDLITEQMAFWDTYFEDSEPIYKSAGKQPAWLNYMTNFDKSYGNFADPRSQMFMTLDRRYSQLGTNIKDLTTYIDPAKFNYTFAQSDLSAMNFWVQIACNITARRKMSAKLIPNL